MTDRFQIGTWYPIDSAPENERINTRINDANGIRNEQIMKRSGKLWWVEGMYVYYAPTEWSPITKREDR